MNYPTWYINAMSDLDDQFETGNMTYNEYRYEMRELNESLSAVQKRDFVLEYETTY